MVGKFRNLHITSAPSPNLFVDSLISSSIWVQKTPELITIPVSVKSCVVDIEPELE